MPELYWNNFKMGQRFDAALRDDALLSGREINNFDIVYAGESADIQIRPGYTRWNSVELPAPAQQLFPFVDMDQNFNLLGISAARWRAIKESGAHVQLVNEAATAPRPVEAFDRRVFFGTDTSAYWTDHNSIGGVNTAYRMGIVKPAGTPTLTPTASTGYDAGTQIGLNSPTVNFHIDSGGGAAREKIAARYTPAADIDVDTIYLDLAWGIGTPGNLTGMIRVMIYSDAAGSPDALIDSDAVTDWVEVTGFDVWASNDDYQWVAFNMRQTQSLTSGVNYWLVVEPNDVYLNNYVNVSPTNRFMVAFRRETPVPGGYAAQRYTGAGNWVADTLMVSFIVNGLHPEHHYDYKFTYVNEDYNSESRPTDQSVRYKTTIGNVALITGPSTLDPQVDYLYVYRRDIGEDGQIAESDITADYRYIGKFVWNLVFTDNIPNSQIGAILHSEDHYLYDEDDDTNQGKRDSFIPAGFVLWKGRIWAWVEGDNKLYFTKVFEKNNPMGLAGESSPDYFPLDNVLSFPVPSGIINAQALSNDQMAVYLRNESIYIVTGADSVLNPPSPTEIAIRPSYLSVGLFAPTAVVPYSGANIFLAREGLYRFRGIGALVPELLSETQTGIFDLIENQYYRNSKLVAYGTELWVLIDSDNDGDLDKLLILDMERDFNTRGIVDRAWRARTYPVAITDLAVHSSGDEFREMLAADAVDGWIMKLNDGDLDNGAAIVGTAESHDIMAPTNALIHKLHLQPYYPDETALPDYDITVTSAKGDTFGVSIVGDDEITGNEDVRGHTIGLRMKRPISVRIKVVMTSTKRDTIRGFAISYDGE